MTLERVSIEVTNRCAKACDFCYNHSLPGGGTRWTPGYRGLESALDGLGLKFCGRTDGR